MAFRIHRGAWQFKDANDNFVTKYKLDRDGSLKETDSSGNIIEKAFFERGETMTVPAEYVTQTEGDGRYLRSVPAEYVTQSEGDGRYALASAPAAPTSPSSRIVGETIEVSFAASANTVDQYQVWAATGSNSFDLIAQIPPQDFSSTMTIVDNTFNSTGTRNYRIYAIRAGKYSNAATTSRSFTISSLEPTNMRVTAMQEAFVVEWDAPASRFVDHYEVYHHSHATQSSLSRSSATLVYSGKNTVFVKPVDDNNYHQFWVEVSTI